MHLQYQSLVSSSLLAITISIWAPQAAMAQAAPQAASATSAATSGETELEEIVVTAQKRSENLQKVPIAVTAFSGASLTNRGLTDIRDIATLTPGLQLNTGNGIVVPFLRGVGSTANAVGNESSVAVYVDGVYFTRLLPSFFSLSNIERIETLKGPQGTLFGRNSSGGVIQIITPDPSHSTKVKAHAGYGSFDTFKGDLYATTGLTDTLAVDVSVSGQKQGVGFGRNLTTGHRAYFDDQFTARAKILWEPADGTKIVLSGFYSSDKSGGAGRSLPGTVAGYASAPFVAQQQVGFYDLTADYDNRILAREHGISLTAQQDLGFAQFKSITAYTLDKEFQNFDLEKSDRPDSIADLNIRIEQITQEFQLSNSPGSALTWIIGAFYYDTKSAYAPITFQGPAIIPGDVVGDGVFNAARIYGQQHVKSYSGYAQATYEILQGFKLTGGIRYTKDKSTVVGGNSLVLNGAETFFPGLNASNSVSRATFKAAADYQFTSNILGYASFSRGMKSGGFNLAPPNPTPIRPEMLDAYEVGLKTELLDRRLRFNLAAFWYDIKDPQVQLLENAAIRVANAGASRVKGLEFDGMFAAAPGLTISFGANYLDSKYTDFRGAPSGPPNPLPPFGTINPLQLIDASGLYTPQAPKFTGTLGATYDFDSSVGRWILSGSYSYNDGYYFEPDNRNRQKAFQVVNGQVSLKPNDFLSVAIWGKNLINEKRVLYSTTQAGSPGYPFIPDQPRSYGITLGFEL